MHQQGGKHHRRRSQPKASPRAAKAPHLRGTAAVLAAAAVVLGVLAGGLALQILSSGGSPPGPKTAAIVDQLSLTQPNPAFAQQATSLLRRAGYTVDYHPGEAVTVDFYRYLPNRGYDLIILRTHSGRVEAVDVATGGTAIEEYVGLFTSEPYSELKYQDEQQPRVGRLAPLGRAAYYDGEDAFFSIGPTFIEDSLEGRFDGTLIVMMGCDGLRSQRTAQAFLDRGAKAFVSWSRPVSASHTDKATQRLLELLLLEGLTATEALARTNADVGPDPWYGGELRLLES